MWDRVIRWVLITAVLMVVVPVGFTAVRQVVWVSADGYSIEGTEAVYRCLHCKHQFKDELSDSHICPQCGMTTP